MSPSPDETTTQTRDEFVLFDLVSRPECEPALLAVLTAPSERWWSSRELSELSEGYRRSCERWAPEAAEVAVTWIHHPDGGEDVCLVIGFRQLRSTTAFYNRAHLLKRYLAK